MISESYIMQLKAACDIVSIISSYTPLKRDGRTQKCLCPFHLEKTPSLVVYENTQSFYCFGCGKGGDVISFIMYIENLEYPEAVKFLSEKVGMTLPEDERDNEQTELRKRIFEMNRLAARFYYSILKGPEGKPAREYFANRRLTAKTISKYGLGYAPNSWDSLRNHLKEKGYSYEEMEKADLVVRSKKDTFYDKFRNRVIFPILDLRGNVIAFGGRVLGDQKPKYLNTSITPVFKKKQNLFSLNFAKNTPDQTLILGEGYMDVISMYQAGFTGAVATLGTAFTPEQAKLISRYAKDVVIAYDSDAAGQYATRMASKLLQRAGVSARILQLEGAKDPDEFIKKYGSGKFKILLDNAGAIMQTQSNLLKKRYNLDDPEEKKKYLLEYCKIIAQNADPLEREVYIGKLSSECSISREVIELQIKHLLKEKRKNERKKDLKLPTEKMAVRDKINPEQDKYPRAAKAEEGVLHFLLAHPDYYSYITEKLSADDFKTLWNRKIYEQISDKLSQNLTVDFSDFYESFSADEISRFSRILNGNGEIAPTSEYLEDCIYILKAEQEKLSKTDILSMTPEQLEKKRLEKAKYKK